MKVSRQIPKTPRFLLSAAKVFLTAASCSMFFALLIPGLSAVSAVPSVREQRLYSPAEGQVVEVTPPPFIWKPIPGAKVYVLQVSTVPAFPAAATQTFTHPTRSAFVPPQPLSPGQWYWRVGVQSQGKTQFGQVHRFTVSPQAQLFPFPDWDRVLPGIPHTRPRLFFPGRYLEQARQWADTQLKPVMDAMEAACQQEAGKELVPEPGPRPKGPALGPWSVNVMNSTRPPMDFMEKCALVYLLRGNRQLGQEARRRLLHFFSWDPEGPTGFSSYDEPAMWMMMRGTRAYDWTYDLFTPAERRQIETTMKVRAGQFLEHLQKLPFESNPYSSHAGRLPGFLGECALSFIHEWPEAREWLEYATLLYYTSFPAWGGDDGGWQEGPHYWKDYMAFALHFVIALRRAAGVDLMKKPFFHNTPYYALYTAPPYHQHLPFGDGQTGDPSDLGPLMYAFSTLTRNPYFRWYAEELKVTAGAELLTLASYDPTLKARSPLELPQGRSFPDVGLVSFHTALGDRDKDIGFLMRSSPYGSVSHGHADQNAYVIEAFSRGLAIATGYYPWYNSPHHDGWTRSTRAVNSILVDGQGQEQRSWEACGQLMAFESVDGYDYAETEAAPAYMGRLQRFRRHVVHVRPGVFVIYDDLQAPRPAQFQWLLHAYHPIEIDETRQIFHVRNEPAAMKVVLLLPRERTLSQTAQYTPEPESAPGTWVNTQHLTAETITPSASTQFLAVLAVYRQGEEDRQPNVELLPGTGAIGVRLTDKKGNRDIVVFRTGMQAGTVTCGGIESAASVFAQGTDKEGRRLRQLCLRRPGGSFEKPPPGPPQNF